MTDNTPSWIEENIEKAFQKALPDTPDDEFNKYHLDEGELRSLFYAMAKAFVRGMPTMHISKPLRSQPCFRDGYMDSLKVECEVTEPEAVQQLRKWAEE